jgi:hypothetical protein
VIPPIDPDAFEDEWGQPPDEVAAEQQAEFAGFSRLEQLHILRGIRLVQDPAVTASYLAEAIAQELESSASTSADIALRVHLHRMLAGEISAFYRDGGLHQIKTSIPRDGEASANATFLQWLVFATLKELNPGLIESFPAFRFLYERIAGPEIRPFLPSAFLAAVTLPRWDWDWSRQAVASVALWNEADRIPPSLFFPSEEIHFSF